MAEDKHADSLEKGQSGTNSPIPDDAQPGAYEDPLVAIGATAEEERAVRWKQDKRIVPLSAGIYFLCYLDRSNIGNAKILNSSTGNDLMTETGMTAYQYTIALMVFLVAYGVFEAPSNILLKKLRPSRWIAILMFAWGGLTISLGGVHNYASVTAVRFLLGVFEAGLFPGLVYYLTFWYKTDERSIRVALILASATLAGAFGGAIAYGVGHMNQVSGLSAWRWLFILEGIPSCVSAVAVWFLLPDWPEDALWLSAREREVAVARLSLEGSKGHHSSMTWPEARDTLTDWRLWGHYVVYFGISVPFSSLSLFTPSITAGLGFSDLRAQLMTVPPYAVAYVVQVLTSYSADHFNMRALHSAALAAIGAAGFIGSAALPVDAYASRYGCLIVAASGAFACIPPLLGWLSSNTFGTASVGLAIALNIGLGGAPGQIVGVWTYKADEAKLGYPTGHWTNAALLLMVAVGCVMLRVYYGWRNRKLIREQGAERVRLYKY
ncbi:major facilitator superfamily domain-containing protein [Microdochium trichocladiopsis]|uniref:Major facilitator superfamily domain-containing protein n=1 Tax=Microdochium trichocladiopsis TaxID=1682393 RepID=A0A9P9BLJ2_9PEZI|nr:major facilitator superfamily domain-containing protein [Microdochium trichocladiopsis]KAH7014147.1 major facilitator superfamily domain-containing protein [Microdochium trichocladiopsis]